MIELDEGATPAAVHRFQLPDADWITVSELAAYLRIPRSTAHLLVDRGEVPHIRVGRHIRIPREAVLRLRQRAEQA